MFWAFWKDQFQFFANFWVMKLKSISGKVRQNVEIDLNQYLGIGTFSKNGFGATMSSKKKCCERLKRAFFSFSQVFEWRNWDHFQGKWGKVLKSKLGHKNLLRRWFWSNLELRKECYERLKRPFSCVFANIWVTKLKPFSGNMWQSVQNYLNQNSVIGSFIENGFEATLSYKTNVLSISKEHFSVVCKSFSDEVQTVFRERETNCSNLFKSKFWQKILLRKWFWSHLGLKNECCERLKRTFSSFLQMFKWGS